MQLLVLNLSQCVAIVLNDIIIYINYLAIEVITNTAKLYVNDGAV